MKRKNRIYRKWSSLTQKERQRFIVACHVGVYAWQGIGTEKDWHKRFSTKSGIKVTLEESLPLEIKTNALGELIIHPAYSIPVIEDPKERKRIWTQFKKMQKELTIVLNDLTVWEEVPKKDLESAWRFYQEQGEPGDWEKQFVFQPAPKME